MTRVWTFLGWSLFWCALVVASPFLLPMEFCFRMIEHDQDAEA